MNILKATITLVLTLTITLLAGCGGDDGSTGPPPTGTLEVTVSTTGDNPDFDGYTLTLDGETSQELASNETVSFNDAEEGTHGLELSEIFENCSVNGDNPRSVNITGDNTTSANFEVSCVEVIEEPDCLSLVPEDVEIDGTRLIEGGSIILSFSLSENAQKARNIIQFYGFTEHCYVERPHAPLRYWLVDVSPPYMADDVPVEEDCISLNPKNVEINEVDGKFQVADGSTGLLAFLELGNAEKARDVIQFYGFTQQCFVGRSGEEDPMMYWLR